MKRIKLFLLCTLLGTMLAACGGIPTLPALDSTVTIKTPQFTIVPALSDEGGEVDHQALTLTPVDSASEPSNTVNIQVQPTATQILPLATEDSAGTETPVVPATTAAPAGPDPTHTPVSYPYQVQALNPVYLPNYTRPEAGCDWLGIGGQIFNREGAVQKDILIKIGGEVAGSPVIEELTMPLAEPAIDLAYGPGGYELTVALAPADSDSTLWIQLFSLEGAALSDQIFLTTYNDCQKNLLLMNFNQK